MEGVPTESDWRSEPWELDTPYAYANFSEKSSQEAFDLFKFNALGFQEDLMSMPKACFFFYVGAYMAYLLSGDSEGDSDGANCFFGLIEIRFEEIRSRRGLLNAVKRVLSHLEKKQLWYDAEVEIYGSFVERARKARSELGG